MGQTPLLLLPPAVVAENSPTVSYPVLGARNVPGRAPQASEGTPSALEQVDDFIFVGDAGESSFSAFVAVDIPWLPPPPATTTATGQCALLCGTQRKRLYVTCADAGAAVLRIAQYRENGGNAGGDVALGGRKSGICLCSAQLCLECRPPALYMHFRLPP